MLVGNQDKLSALLKARVPPRAGPFHQSDGQWGFHSKKLPAPE